MSGLAVWLEPFRYTQVPTGNDVSYGFHSMSYSWAATEFETINLGDPRRRWIGAKIKARTWQGSWVTGIDPGRCWSLFEGDQCSLKDVESMARNAFQGALNAE